MVSAEKQSGGPTSRPTPEALSHLLVGVCPGGIAVFDDDGVTTFANPELERLLGLPPGGMLGRPIDAFLRLLVHTSRALRPARTLLEYAQRCDPSRLSAAIELRGLAGSGGELPVEGRLARVPELGFVLLAVDITHRKHEDRAMKQRMRELEQSNSDLEQFASIASHDLREPLRMVVSYTQLLAERYRGQLDEKADKFINYAVQGATRMQRLIDDLLAYARLENPGRPSLPIAVQDALRDTLSDMRVLIQDSGARIVYGELPTVLVDPVQLAQLFQNLIHNAIKFRRQDPPVIEISAEREGGMWKVAIKDNGIGIEKRYQDRIFQMFQRLHERGKYEGNGIGLATARKIVERHGGTIGLVSTPGQGSTFYFTLPAAPTGPVTIEAK
jgi:PAS domain S-box-containing protein